MQDAQSRAWLALHHTPKLSPSILCKLLEFFEDPEQIPHLNNSCLEEWGFKPKLVNILSQTRSAQVQQAASTSLAVIKRLGATILPIVSNHYPALLKEISDPPPIIYARGDYSLLDQPQIAMVGSRRCTASAREQAVQLAKALVASGLTVTSGMALGIDGAAHKGALNHGGKTIAVMATGIDVCYPASHQPVIFSDC